MCLDVGYGFRTGTGAKINGFGNRGFRSDAEDRYRDLSVKMQDSGAVCTTGIKENTATASTEFRIRAEKRVIEREYSPGADFKNPIIPRIISHTLVIKMMTAARIAGGTIFLAACVIKTSFLLFIVLKKCGQVRHMNIAVP